MTPLEQQVRQILDDEALDDDARKAPFERLIAEHSREQVAHAFNKWKEAKIAWVRSLADDLATLTGKNPRKH
jgi:hypothetical protein